MEKLYTIRLREDGKWQLFRIGNKRATRVFDLEDDALNYAHDLAKKPGIRILNDHAPKSLVGVVPEYKEETEPKLHFSVEDSLKQQNKYTIDTQLDMEYHPQLKK
jgi:hypothetical protein